MKTILTPELTATSMCATCRFASHVTGVKFNQTLTKCRTFDALITFPVTSCSDYEDKATPTLHDMYQQAWKISADKKANAAGFTDAKMVKVLNPKEFKQQAKDGKVATTTMDEDYDFSLS